MILDMYRSLREYLSRISIMSCWMIRLRSSMNVHMELDKWNLELSYGPLRLDKSSVSQSSTRRRDSLC